MSYFNYFNRRIYFEEAGSGPPLLFLHGNTASSKMFQPILNLYQKEFKTIIIDFMGHGRSERIPVFPPDLWFDEAMQVIALIEELNYKKVNLAGSSGGALVALNAGLERPDLIHKIIADSFEGEVPLSAFVENIKEEREASKHDENTRQFYIDNHGADWEHVVDCDTAAMYEHHKSIGHFFRKPLSALNAPVLLTGSTMDEFAPDGFYKDTYSGLMKKLPNGKMHLFHRGGHPAMTTNALEFSTIAKSFFSE